VKIPKGYKKKGGKRNRDFNL